MSEHAEFSESNKFDSFFMSAKTGDQVVDCFKRICISLNPDFGGDDSSEEEDEEGEVDEKTGKVSNMTKEHTIDPKSLNPHKENRRTSKCIIW